MKTLLLIAAMVILPWVCVAEEPPAANEKDQQIPTTNQSTEPSVRLEPKGEARHPSVWMQQKLGLSQKVFAGLTEGDLVKVKQSAQTMQLLSKLELFVRRRSPAYRNQLRMFEFANAELIEGAMENNLERATLAYTQLSISCISCHKQLRKARD